MKPVTVCTTVPQGVEEVYDFLDVLGNHEAFTDHFLQDWDLAGPASGVGAKARMRVAMPGPDDWVDMEVIEAERPRTSVEESTSAGGKRHTRGTYVLDELPQGGTKVTFTIEWLQAPLPDRLGAPVTRAVMKRANRKAMERLAQTLAARQG
jgi:Polyketide cyclase / dehydrase and lipid transport